MFIVYASKPLGELNSGRYYSVDESLFNHIVDKQIWVLGIINNVTKNFRLEASLNRT
jgi:hypothetical protein